MNTSRKIKVVILTFILIVSIPPLLLVFLYLFTDKDSYRNLELLCTPKILKDLTTEEPAFTPQLPHLSCLN